MSGLPRFEEGGWALIAADVFDVLPTLPDQSVDAVITDPPYGIGFRAEDWDRPTLEARVTIGLAKGSAERFERWTTGWAAECLRVLKPGGYLLAFGSPRTAHRLTAGVEDAGFEIRDSLVWLFGSGVPKSGLVNGRSSTLKPGYEPILLARAPLTGTTDSNEAAWGTGRLGTNETRIDDEQGGLGRWPSNVALTHGGSCSATRCAGGCPTRLLDRSRPLARPSRFYYCPKPTARERDTGCEALPARSAPVYRTRASKPRRNTHPTVKPTELMGWLVKLVCPPGGIVLDVFAGSGTTGVACLHEERRFLGIERDPSYARIARARLRDAERETGRRRRAARRAAA